MPTTRLRAVVALAFAAGVASLSACGGDSGSGGPSFPDSVSTADAQSAAGLAGDFAGQMMSFMNFATPGLAAPMQVRSLPFAAARLGAAPRFVTRTGLDLRTTSPLQAAAQLAASEGCTTTAHGWYDYADLASDPVDDNGNGIPDDAALRIECVMTDSVSSPDTTLTSSLFIDISIKERTGDLFGFDFGVTERIRNANDHGDFLQNQIQETIHNSINAGNANNSVLITESADSSLSGTAGHFEDGQSWSGNFDPTGTITLGDDLPDGALNFTGRVWVFDGSSSSWSFNLSTPTPLAYDASCAAAATNPPFTAGQVRGLLNANSSSASFTATFTGCGNAPTVATEGTFAAPPIAAR